jgi:TRAP-type mannitol/chloroaromatic compound transport system permease large subunit
MTNDTLLSIPLFVFMGYIMERAALVDRMFHSVQLAFRRVPASLAVTTLLVCAFWGIASGIVGAVVVLMGVIAMRPMLNAGYDVKLASGAITAGGTLGILIPPSVMLIVYAAVAGQSIVKLYAAAMLPGFFLTFLYLVYILGWAIINPKIAPKLPPDQYRVAVPEYLRRLEGGRSGSVVPGLLAAAFRPARIRGARAEGGRPAGYGVLAKHLLVLSVPVFLTVGTFAATWWYVVVYNAPEAVATTAAPAKTAAVSAPPAASAPAAPADDKPQEVGLAGEATDTESAANPDGPPQEVTSFVDRTTSSSGKVPAHFYAWFWGLAAVFGLLLLVYFWRMDGEQLEILRELCASVVPLGVLTVVVLAVILFGICTATESAAIGALGALYLAVMSRYMRPVLWWLHRRDRARLVRGRGLRLAARRGRDRRDPAGHRRARALVSADLAGAAPQHQGVDVPHGEDHGDGVLALRRLGAVLRGVCAPRRPGLDRAVGAEPEPVAAGLSVRGAGDHLPPRLAARVDRDHCDLLPDLHPAAGSLQRRPDPLRHHGRRESAGGLPVAAGGDVGLLSEGSLAAARDAESDLRRHDAVHDHRLYLPRVHVHLARHDPLAPGISLREVGSEGAFTYSATPFRLRGAA